MKINKLISKFNFTKYFNRKILYIVMHYVGAVSTAKNNATYFKNGNRNASAHYFVDEKSIWQSVLDKNAAWAVGGGLLDQGSVYAKFGAKFYGKCTNANSISIEMCCKKKNGKLYIDDKTIDNTAELVQYLMELHDVPAENVIRHFDVNGKLCPLPYVKTEDWNELHEILTGKKQGKYSGKFPVLPKKGYLSNGDEGVQVGRLQEFLNWYGDYGLKIDKDFGPKTENAVKKFQDLEGLVVDGLFGAKSLAKAKTIKK